MYWNIYLERVALLSVILGGRIELIYLQTIYLCGFHLLQRSKSSQHQSPSVNNYCIYIIQYSLFDYCWMIVAEHFPQSLSSSFEEARGSTEYGTNLLGSLQLLENYKYLLCFCVLTLILLKKNFFERCDVIEFS